MDVAAALLCALASMVLWGTWANAMLLARVRFELFFLDYALGNALLGALRLPWALPSLGRAVAVAWPSGVESFGIGAAAGLFYALGVLLLVNAIDLAGMALAVPLVLGSEFAIGVPLLLVIEGPGSPAHVALSAAAVAAVLCALAFDRACHVRLAADRAVAGLDGEVVASTLSALSFRASLLRGEASLFGSGRISEEVPRPARGGAGLCLALVAGSFLALWPCLSSISEGKGALGQKVELGEAALTPEAFYVVFVAGALATALLVVPFLGRCPLDGGPPFAIVKSYLSLPCRAHILGLMGGLAQGLGTFLSLQAGEALGNAAALSITRCSPVVAGLWGMCAWGELDGARGPTLAFFVGTVVAFLLAVALLGLAGAAAAPPALVPVNASMATA